MLHSELLLRVWDCLQQGKNVHNRCDNTNTENQQVKRGGRAEEREELVWGEELQRISDRVAVQGNVRRADLPEPHIPVPQALTV